MDAEERSGTLKALLDRVSISLHHFSLLVVLLYTCFRICSRLVYSYMLFGVFFIVYVPGVLKLPSVPRIFWWSAGFACASYTVTIGAFFFCERAALGYGAMI